MSLHTDPADAGLARLAELQQSLIGRIEAAAEDLRRSESLDEEQRAEIHAILEAIRHESVSHAALFGTYISEAADA